MSSSVLIIEAFYGGSHKQLVDVLVQNIPGCDLWTLPAKKWHWRARTAAIYFSQVIPHNDEYRVLMCSSVLNLAELVALRPDLAKLRKIIYFHENQLVYPVRKQQERDFQYGYNQILASMVADAVIFNSKYNMESFLNNIPSFLKLIPDHRPRGLVEQIRPKCSVLHFPIQFPDGRPAKDPPQTDVSPNRHCEIHHKTDRPKTTTEQVDLVQGQGQGHSGDSLSLTSEEEMQVETVSVAGGDKDCTRQGGICDAGRTKQFSSKPVRGETDDGASVSLCEHPSEASCTGMKMTATQSKKSKLSDGISREEECRVADKNHSVLQTEQKLDAEIHKSVAGAGNSRMETDIALSSEVKVHGHASTCDTGVDSPLHIVWPHRWEHDKDPDTFFNMLYQLDSDGVAFKLSVLGETFSQIPDIFEEAAAQLKSHIVNWGYLPSKAAYYQVLHDADVVVSTANHEFFGVAMLEAVHCGCYPLCPNRLVYPEIFPAENLYNTPNQLRKRLKQLAERPNKIRNSFTKMNVERYSWTHLASAYKELLSPS